MKDYAKEYEELLVDMWNIMGAILDDQSYLHHQNSQSSHLAGVTRSVMPEMMGRDIFTNDREAWQKTIKKYEDINRRRHD